MPSLLRLRITPDGQEPWHFTDDALYAAMAWIRDSKLIRAWVVDAAEFDILWEEQSDRPKTEETRTKFAAAAALGRVVAVRVTYA